MCPVWILDHTMQEKQHGWLLALHIKETGLQNVMSKLSGTPEIAKHLVVAASQFQPTLVISLFQLTRTGDIYEQRPLIARKHIY